MSIRPGSIPIEEQAAVIDALVLNAAYGTARSEQDLPEYTTTDYALLPSFPVNNSTSGVNETWTMRL